MLFRSIGVAADTAGKEVSGKLQRRLNLDSAFDEVGPEQNDAGCFEGAIVHRQGRRRRGLTLLRHAARTIYSSALTGNRCGLRSHRLTFVEGPSRLGRPSIPREEFGPSQSVGGPAPKEQPPRKLSGTRTRGRGHSGEQAATPHRRGKPGSRVNLSGSRDRGGGFARISVPMPHETLSEILMWPIQAR